MKKICLALSLLLCINLTAQYTWKHTGSASSMFSVSGTVLGLCEDSKGNIYCTGTFKNKNNKYYVAKWDGTNWTEVGTLNNNNYALQIVADKNDNLYMSGYFTDSGVSIVLKWDGSNWTKLGNAKNFNTLNSAYAINSLCTDSKGNLYVAHGNPTLRKGNYEFDIYKWDGKIWSIVGDTAGLRGNKACYTLATDANDNLYAAGSFTNASGKYYVAKWDGSKWSELGAGGNELNANETIWSVCIDKKGNLFAGGRFSNAYNKVYVAKWNGTNWNAVGDDSSFFSNGSNTQINAIDVDSNGNVYAGGRMYTKNNKFYLPVYDGTQWKQTGNKEFNAYFYNLLVSSKNNIYVAGGYTDSTGKAYLAEYSPATTTALNTQITELNELRIYPNPVNDFIKVNPENGVSKTNYSLRDITGKIIFSGKISNDELINVSPLKSGIYLLNIEGKGTYRLMKN